MIKRVYLAARYGWKVQMLKVEEDLKAHGIEVTSRWIRGETDADFFGETTAALMDLEDVDRADALILFSDSESGGSGRHFESGYARARGKPIFIVSEAESVFHFLPGIIICASLDELIPLLV